MHDQRCQPGRRGGVSNLSQASREAFMLGQCQRLFSGSKDVPSCSSSTHLVQQKDRRQKLCVIRNYQHKPAHLLLESVLHRRPQNSVCICLLLHGATSSFCSELLSKTVSKRYPDACETRAEQWLTSVDTCSISTTHCSIPSCAKIRAAGHAVFHSTTHEAACKQTRCSEQSRRTLPGEAPQGPLQSLALSRRCSCLWKDNGSCFAGLRTSELRR